MKELKEYSDLMEMVDHVVDYDVSLVSLLFNDGVTSTSASGNSSSIGGSGAGGTGTGDTGGTGGTSASTSITTTKKLTSSSASAMGSGDGSDKISSLISISDEQCKLLYSGEVVKKNPVWPKDGNDTNAKDEDGKDGTYEDSSSSSSTTIPYHLKDWGKENIITTRTAWAKLRLVEEEEDNLTMNLPGVIGGGSGVATTATVATTVTSTSTSDDPMTSKYTWLNEDKASTDECLALVSEATQQYIKTILEAAVSSSRQRMNLDGIRIWHQQISSAAEKIALKTSAASTPPHLINDPPLHLRLGCDVRRQCALAEGNAAKTCQRMEEALARNEKSDGGIRNSNDSNSGTSIRKKRKMEDESTWNDIGSMSELSKVPVLSNASKKAEYYAKRNYEIYGGKHSGEPPLGRVPKKIKISSSDIQVCMKHSGLSGVLGGRRQRRMRTFY